MNTFFVILVIALSVLSIILMLINMYEFRHVQQKRITLLSSLGSDRIEHERKYGSLLVWIYCIATLAVFGVTLFLAIVKPHII